jgi:hypothetical protein
LRVVPQWRFPQQAALHTERKRAEAALRASELDLKSELGGGTTIQWGIKSSVRLPKTGSRRRFHTSRRRGHAMTA